jgi:tRNA (guanine-N7-)-methyltransferase
MARLRKAARIWQSSGAQLNAQQVMIGDLGGLWRLDPPAIFGRQAPIEIEIGAGRGDFLIGRAVNNPDRDFLAIERAVTVARVMAVRAGRLGLTNLKVACGDARTIIAFLLADASVSAYHCYFPDPWPKARHQKNRLMSPTMIQGMIRTLVEDGRVYVASDVKEWAETMFAALSVGGFTRIANSAPGAELTGFGRKYIRQGRPLFCASFALNDALSGQNTAARDAEKSSCVRRAQCLV